MTMATDRSRAATTAPSLPDGVWRVDPARSAVGFAVSELWGLRTVRGAFGAFRGVLEVRAGDAAGELTIEAATLATGNQRRDKHLRSPVFFDVERHPLIVFTTAAIRPQDSGLTLAGQLKIGSSRVGLEIPVDVEPVAAGTLRLQGRAAVSRAAAGLDWNALGTIRGDAALHAQLTLERATA